MLDAASLAPPPTLADLRTEGELALFLDFDGTLVEIAAKPDAIDVPPGLAEDLAALAKRLSGRLALVSGRALDNLEMHLGALNVAQAGSHGASRLRADGSRIGEEPEALGAAVMKRLETYCATEGLDLEVKQHGAALHYRASPEREADVRRFAATVAEEHGLALKLGKCVAELVHPGTGKAGAVRAFMDDPLFAGATPVFIGDDITDEDGFEAATQKGGFGIIVGERTGTLAKYRLETVRDVHQWLKL